MASESPSGGKSFWRRASAKQRRRRSAERLALRRRRGLFETLETRWLMAKDLNVRFEFTDLSNNPLTALQVGQDIQLRVWVQDIRTSPQAVFQAYLDVNYDNALISPNGPITHGPDFGNAGTTSGSLTTPGLIDEVGSRDFDQAKPANTAAEELLFSVPFHVNAAGNVTITADLADVPTNKILFFDTVTGVPLSDIQFQGGTASISAGPAVSSITKADPDPTAAAQVHYTVTFDKDVTGVDTGDFALASTVTGASIASVTPVSASVYTVTVNTGTGDGTIGLNAVDNDTIRDSGNQPLGGTGAGNGNFTGPLYTIDRSGPTVTINQAAGQADPTNSATINFTVIFSETVTNFATGDVTLGGTAGATTAVVTGSGTTYNVAVSGMTGPGTVTAGLAAGVAGDAAGNTNAASTSTDNSVTFDNQAPSVTINQAAGQSDPTNSSPINFTVVFSEAVTGFTSGDLTLGGTAPGTLIALVTGSGTTYNVAVSGMTGPGTVTASVVANAAIDAANNQSTASTSTDNSVTFDNQAPTVSINQAAGQSDPTGSSPINFTVIFSEPVTNFATGDVALGGTAGATTAVVTGSGTTYNVAVSGMTGSGTVSASIGAGVASDAAGNQNVASTSSDNTVTFDNVQPTVTINQAAGQSDPTNASPINFTVVFSEPVTGFTSSDVALSGTAPGTLSAVVTGSGTTYNVAVSGMTGSGTVIANVVAGAAVDTSNNSSAASTSTDNTANFDNVQPTVTINQAIGQNDPTNSSPINFTVVFSEPVTGFTSADVSLSGTAPGTLSAIVTGTGTTYNVAVSGMTASGTVVASINAGVASDSAGNGNAASTSTDNSVNYDVVGPTVTINQAVAQTDPTNSSPINFTVIFSEPVTNFTTGDVTLSGTAGATTAIVTGSGTTYNVAVNGMTSSGTVIASINAGVASDAAGNANAASTSTDNTVNFDNSSPTVTINQAAGQADPTNQTTINFTVVFSEPVSNFATGDVMLGGTAGATTAVVTGSGTTYNVAVSGMTGSGTVIASIDPGVASDAAGNANAASTSTDNTVTFDNVQPTVTINQAAGQADPTSGSTINFTVIFSEVVTNFATGDVALSGTAGATTAVVTGSGATYNVAVTGMTGSGTVIASINAGVASDAAGNANAASTSTDNTVTYDVTAPTVTINQAAGQSDPTNESPINFTVIFSESVTGFTASDLSLGGTAPGAIVAVVTGSGTTYNVAVSGMTDSGTVTASVNTSAATDSAGNPSAASTSTDNTVTYDITLPTVTINQAAAQTDPTNASTINFTVVFSKPVTGFTGTDVTLSGTAPGTLTAIVTGSGTTYNVAVSGMTGSGTVIASLGANVANDTANNGNVASTSTDNTVTYDATAPAVTIDQAGDQLDPTNGSTINFTVVFNEPVANFTTGDVTLGGTAGATTATVTGSGTTYNVAVTGMTASGTVIASINAAVASDAAGNSNTASTSIDNTVTYDIVAPTVTINQAAGQADPTNASPINFTVVFSEVVTGFTSSDLTFGGTAPGTLVAVVTGSGTTYNVAVSGMTGSGTVTASVNASAAIDSAGNSSAASTSTDNTVTYDITLPTVTINQATSQTDPTNTSPINFTVVFSEAVTGFTGADVTLSGTAPGTLVAVVTGSGTTYNVAVSGMTASGTVIASLGANVANDTAGNGNSASTSTDNVVNYDVISPTVTINQAAGQADPTNGSTINFTVIFSEAVTNFATGDVTLSGTAGATTAVVTGSGTTYNVAVTGMTVSGTVIASIGAGVATDAAGNANVASTSTDNTVTYDIIAPTVTINQAAGQSDPSAISPINFTVVFSEPVTGFTAADVQLSGTAPGALTAVVTGSGTTYNVAVSGMTNNGTVIASVSAGAANDAAGNASAASTSTDNTVDFIGGTATPVVTSIVRAGSNPTNFASVVFTVTFNTSVTGVDTSDFALTTAGLTGASVTNVTGSGASYTVTVNTGTGDGTVRLDVVDDDSIRNIANVPLGGTETGNGDFNSGEAYQIDKTLPTVTINQAAGQSDPTNSSPINFTVVFNEAVTGFDAADITFGGTAPGTLTALVTGSGTTYNVAVSGMTATGTVTASVVASAATDAAGNDNAASTSTDNSVTYDITLPTVTIDQAAGQADPTNASPINFTVVFSESVTGFTAADLLLGGTVGGTLVALVTGSGTTYNVAVSGMTGSGTVTATVVTAAAVDMAGNSSTASTSTDNTVTFDSVAPTVTINQAAGQSDPTSTSPINFTVIFSEPVTNFATGDVTLSGTAGATTAVVTGSGTTYNVAVSGMTGSGTVIASINAGVAIDAAGNQNQASSSDDNTVTFDNQTPTVTINQASGQADPTNSSPINFTVIFSESVTGFTSADIALSGTATGTLSAVVTGSGTTYNVAVSGMTGSGTVIASVVAGAAVDSSNNPSAASTSTDNSVTFDNVQPTVTINQASGQVDPTNASPINFTVVFSEAVTGFGNGDVQLGGTATGTLVATVTGSGTTYNVAVSGMTGSGTVTASVISNAATDAAGNNNVASTSTDNSVTFDITGPTVTINQAAGQSDPTNASPINFTVVFSEPVTGFTSGDIALSGTAGATTAVVTGSGTTYNVAVSGMTSPGTVIASINANVASDAAGNPNAASTSTDNTVTFNSTPITVTINQAAGQADPASSSPINFTVTFSTPVTNFATGDVTLSGTAGATTAVVTGSGTTYNVAVSGMAGPGTVIATINAAVASDDAGNQNQASTSTDNTVAFDNAAPTVTINQATGQSDPATTSPVNFTVIFSEPVTGFTSADVLLSGTAGATTAVVTGSGTTYNVAVSGMTTKGTVIATLAAGAASDTAGNTSAASTSTDNTVTFDTIPSVVNAGGPYTVSEGGTVTLSGTASDAGDSLTFAWDLDGDGNFGETGSAAARGNETGATPLFNAATLSGPATQTLTLRVTDTGGNSVTSTASLTVNNVPPAAFAGGPYSVDEGGTVALEGVGIDPVDGGTFTWDLDGDGNFGETGSAAARGNEIGATPVFNASGVSGPDTITATLRVTDTDGASATSTALVTINNVAPTVNAGGPYTVAEGGAVNLNGTGADVVDAVILTWDLDGDGNFGETGSAAARGNETGATPLYNASGINGPTTRSVTLRVTDANGASTSSAAVINITGSLPTANAGGPYTVGEGGSTTLSGTGTDPSGGAVTFAWDLDGDGNFGETGSAAARGNETGATPTFNSSGINGPATRSVTLRVTDANSASVNSTALINITASQPTVNAGGPYTVSEGGSTTLTGTGTDPSGGAVTLAWDLDGDGNFGETGSAAARGNETGATPTFSASGVNGPSTSTVTLRVSDASGSSVTGTTTVNVTNVAPTADAGGPYTVSNAGTVSLTGTGTDPVDTVTFSWDLDGDGNFGETGSAAARGNETGSNPIFNASGLSTGTSSTVTLRVTDASSAQTTDTAVVTVATPALTIGNVNVNEGDTGTVNMVFTVTLSGASTSVVTVQFATGGGTATAGTDYTATSGTLTFQPGTTTQTITVSVTGDTLDESNETFNVTLSNASGATLPSAAAIGTINDNDNPTSQPNTARLGDNPTNPGTQALIIEGTSGNDEIKIKRHRRNIMVFINGVNKGSFPISSVPQLVIYGHEGNDNIVVSRRVKVSAYINGNAGDDIIKGTRRPDLLLGGGGSDKIWGRKGKDVIIAGTEADTVRAGKSQDLIVTGSTTHDNDEPALGDLLQMWSASAEYDTRLNTIRTATSPAPALTTQTVLDDSAVDQAFGQSGRDWYWGNTATDRMRVRTKKNEKVN